MEGGGTSPRETLLHPGTSSGTLRWHPWDAEGVMQVWVRVGSTMGISCRQPLCISPVVSHKGGLGYLILSGRRTLIYAALSSALLCRFTRRFSMRAASLTEIKGSPQSPRYYAQTYKSGLNI